MAKQQEVFIHSSESCQLVIVSGDDLEVVTGGGVVSAGRWVGRQVASFFSGINIGIGVGDNNRIAVGNQGPTTLGDNSPINGQ